MSSRQEEPARQPVVRWFPTENRCRHRAVVDPAAERGPRASTDRSVEMTPDLRCRGQPEIESCELGLVFPNTEFRSDFFSSGLWLGDAARDGMAMAPLPITSIFLALLENGAILDLDFLLMSCDVAHRCGHLLIREIEPVADQLWRTLSLQIVHDAV